MRKQVILRVPAKRATGDTGEHRAPMPATAAREERVLTAPTPRERHPLFDPRAWW
jgi:hypothetical protein